MVDEIDGVWIKDLKVIPDERGRLMEILRADDEAFEKFGQVYLSPTYPGVVKGWHFHKQQDDFFACVRGMVKLGLRADQRDAVRRAAREAPRLAAELRRELRPSELYELLLAEPAEGLALSLALRAPAEPILRFVTDLRPVGLEITGEDLIAAGVPESPALGEALRGVLRRKLDGELAGRDQELEAALQEARR